MQRLVTGARFAAAGMAKNQAHGLKNQFQAQARSLQDFAYIKGSYLLGSRTPLIGHLTDLEVKDSSNRIVYPSMIAQGLNPNNENKPVTQLLQSLFHQNPIDQKITVTQHDKGMIRAIPPAGIAYLLDNPGKQNDDTFIEQWYQKYVTFQDQINQPFSQVSFTKKARQFLKNFRAAAQTVKPEQVSSVLLSVLFKNARDKKDLQEFATCYGVMLPEENYTKADFIEFEKRIREGEVPSSNLSSLENLEQCSYWLLKNEEYNSGELVYDTKLLRVPGISLGYKGQPLRALCVEETIRTFLNTLLYNPITKQLDISLLPQKVQSSCNQDLLQFIEKYKTFERSDLIDKQSAQDFLNLVSNKLGITYYNGKNYELASSLDNTLNLLKDLFGLPAITSYQELAEVLSTDTRTITFVSDSNGRDVVFGIYKNVELMLHFDLGHSYSRFKIVSNNSGLESIIQGAFSYISTAPLILSPWIFNDLDFKTVSPAAFEELLAQKDCVIDPLFFAKMAGGVRDNSKNQELLTILINKLESLDIQLPPNQLKEFFFGLMGVNDELSSLKAAEKLVATGYRFSAHDISDEIIACNKHFILPFCLEHTIENILSIDHAAMAVSYNAAECLKILIDKGYVYDNGTRVIDLFNEAIPQSDTGDCLKILLEWKPYLAQSSGARPLFIALASGRSVSIFKILIEAGCNFYGIDEFGRVAIDLIKKRFKHDDLFLDYLKSKEMDSATIIPNSLKVLLNKKDFIPNYKFMDDLANTIPAYINKFSKEESYLDQLKLLEFFIDKVFITDKLGRRYEYFLKEFIRERQDHIENMLRAIDLKDNNEVLSICQKLAALEGFHFSQVFICDVIKSKKYTILPSL